MCRSLNSPQHGIGILSTPESGLFVFEHRRESYNFSDGLRQSAALIKFIIKHVYMRCEAPGQVFSVNSSKRILDFVLKDASTHMGTPADDISGSFLDR